MAITDWPTEHRPRERLLAQGPMALSDAELLAVFLRTGIRGKTAIDLARDILTQFGNLRTLLEATPQQFPKVPGLGIAKLAQLQAILEIGRRHLLQAVADREVIATSNETRSFLLAHLRQREQEVFACLFLDARHRLIRYEELFYGTINYAPVYPREIVKRALAHNAAAVILAHNHPSGVAEPSRADKCMTQQLKTALALIEVRILDHIIIGEGQATSFAELGLL